MGNGLLHNFSIKLQDLRFKLVVFMRITQKISI